MKPIRLFITGDWHLCRSYYAQVAPAVREFTEAVERERPDAVLHAGDLFNRAGDLSPLELFFARTEIERIRNVCPFVVIDGNHDRNNAANEPDSLTGAFLYGDVREPTTGFIVVSDPSIVSRPIRDSALRVVCLPYPSRASIGEGTDMAPDAVAARASASITSSMKMLSEACGAQYPTIGLFHGTIEGGEIGPEQVIETDGEVVIKQTDIPASLLGFFAGHLHVPQRVGRGVYTGSIACPTWAERSVRPSYLEVVMFPSAEGVTETLRSLGPLNEWFNPNEGWPVDSKWSIFCRRRPISVAQPLLTIDLRGDLPLDASQEMIVQRVAGRADDINGSRVRVRAAVRRAQRAAYDPAVIEEAIMSHGAASARALLEYRADQAFTASEKLHGTTNIVKAMDLFLDANPDLVRFRSEIISMTEKVESELPQEVKDDVDPVEYRLVSLSWENWKQHGSGQLNLDALPGLVSIEGPNYAGKSNLAELEPFVFWGAVRSDLGADRGHGSLVRAVRNGQRLCTATAVFETASGRFRVVRTVKLAGDIDAAKATGSVKMERWKDNRWTDSLTGKQAQKEIEKKVGKLKTYLDTRLSSQMDIDRIFSMGLADLQRTIHEACHLSAYEHRHKASAAYVSDAKSKLEQARAAYEEASQAGGCLEDVERLLAECHKGHELISSLVKVAEEEKDAADREVARVVSLTGAVEGLRQASAMAQSHRAAAKATFFQSVAAHTEDKNKHLQAMDLIAASREAADDVARLQAAAADLFALENEKAGHMEKKAEMERRMSAVVSADLRILHAQRAIDQLIDAWEAAKREAMSAHEKTLMEWGKADADARNEAKFAARNIEVYAESHQRSRKTIEDTIARLSTSAGLIDKVPCGEAENWEIDRPISFQQPPPTPKTVNLSGTCPLLANARTAKAEIEEYQSKLDAWPAESEQMVKEKARLDQANTIVAMLERTKPSGEFDFSIPKPEPTSNEMKAAIAERQQAEADAAAVGYDSLAHDECSQRLSDAMRQDPRGRLDAAKSKIEHLPVLEESAAAARRLRARSCQRRREANTAFLTADRQAAAAAAELLRASETHGPALAAAESAAAAAARRLLSERAGLQDATLALGAANAQAEEARKACARATLLRGDVEIADAAFTVATAYQSAVSRQGIPYLIGEQALPYIEERANHYLSESGKQVRFRSDGADFDVFFTDDTGEHHRTEASGFDKAAMGISCRLAMADTASLFGGSVARHYIQDEGFGACEQGNVLILLDVLRSAAKARDMVMVISHVPSVHMAADHRLLVHYDAVNGSTVTGTGTKAVDQEELVLL